jgi:hypothetical protein
MNIKGLTNEVYVMMSALCESMTTPKLQEEPLHGNAAMTGRDQHFWQAVGQRLQAAPYICAASRERGSMHFI